MHLSISLDFAKTKDSVYKTRLAIQTLIREFRLERSGMSRDLIDNSKEKIRGLNLGDLWRLVKNLWRSIKWI